MEEVWKRVEGGDNNYYEASNLGRVRHIVTNYLGEMLAPSALYSRVTWGKKNGRNHTEMIHRVVAKAFLGPCPEGLVVNHKDGNKLNNRIDNLEYVTPKENSTHAAALGLYKTGAEHHWNTRPELRKRGEENGNSKLHPEQVKEIRRLAVAGHPHKYIAGLFDIVPTTVGWIVSRKTWRHI